MDRNRRRKKKDENNGAHWMDTYGDMVTLLLCFFVLLYSFSTISEKKWKELVYSFTEHFGQKSEESKGKIEDLPDDIELPDFSLEPGHTSEPEEEDIDKLYIGIKEYIKESGLDASIGVSRSEFEIIIRFLDSIMFDSGKADLKDESIPILNSIADVLIEYYDEIKMVRIEGHTDNVPIRNSKYPSNWELSTNRATQVLRYMIESKNFDPKKISAVGYGEYHPIDDNNTALGRSKNRRVDFVITRNVKFDN